MRHRTNHRVPGFSAEVSLEEARQVYRQSWFGGLAIAGISPAYDENDCIVDCAENGFSLRFALCVCKGMCPGR